MNPPRNSTLTSRLQFRGGAASQWWVNKYSTWDKKKPFPGKAEKHQIWNGIPTGVRKMLFSPTLLSFFFPSRNTGPTENHWSQLQQPKGEERQRAILSDRSGWNPYLKMCLLWAWSFYYNHVWTQRWEWSVPKRWEAVVGKKVERTLVPSWQECQMMQCSGWSGLGDSFSTTEIHSIQQ